MIHAAWSDQLWCGQSLFIVVSLVFALGFNLIPMAQRRGTLVGAVCVWNVTAVASRSGHRVRVGC